MNICVFDTETTNLEKPFCYNIGFVIIDTDKWEILIQKDGTIVSTTTNVEPARYPRLITKDLGIRYPKAKISKFQKIDYDSKYKRSVTETKLDTYYYIELTEKIKGKSDKKHIKLTYDKSYKYQGLAGSDDEYAEDDE